MVGICFWGSSGRVEDCRVTGFRGSTLGSAEGLGVLVLNSVILGTGVVDVQVLRSTFADNLISIDMLGDYGDQHQPTPDRTLLRTTFAINNNTVVGSGPDSTDAQFGIWIEYGAGGEVKWNTISDYSYTGTNPGPGHGALAAIGIVANDSYGFGRGPLAALQPVRYEGNVFRDNQWHFIAFVADGSTIVNNSFEGTAPGVRHTGVAFSGDNVLVSSNRFSDMPLGILLFGDDDPWLDVYGFPPHYFGIASNATIVANGFCNVATNILAEPPATYTEQGTLPCPVPTLNISRAVLLSWPFSFTGYSVETATNMDGPWNLLEATPVLQDGQSSVAIPADSDLRIFRLVKP